MTSERERAEGRVLGALYGAVGERLADPKNRAKGTWKRIGDLDLVRLARVELDELERAIDHGNPAEIRAEAADVCAFLGMLIERMES